MTENEAIRDLDIIRFNQHWDELVKEEYWEELMTMALNALKEIQQYRAIGTVGGYENAIKAYTETYILMKEYKSKLQDFEAIGTIEEFKALKKEVELYRNLDKTNFSDGYAKAIDEFAERVKKLYQAYDIDLCLQDNDHLNYTDSRIALESYIDEIAEQLKAGVKQ